MPSRKLSRNNFTADDERLMWYFLYERLQAGDVAAKKPKRLNIWQYFEATAITNKKATSLAQHFRDVMYNNIEKAELPAECVLYLASQLNIHLSEDQRKNIESKENMTVARENHGNVTVNNNDEGSKTEVRKSEKIPGETTPGSSKSYNAQKESKIEGSSPGSENPSEKKIGDKHDHEQNGIESSSEQLERITGGSLYLKSLLLIEVLRKLSD